MLLSVANSGLRESFRHLSQEMAAQRLFFLLNCRFFSIMNYKTYQQVLDLSGCKETHSKRMTKTTPGTAKKRTKSGCLTCRSRKKKCDENKVDGKCQACIRNFLDCCWPSFAAKDSTATPVAVASIKFEAHASVTPTRIIKSGPTLSTTNGANAILSPVSSPRLVTVEENHEVLTKSIPSMKVCKPQKNLQASKIAQFVVTSFDKDRLLCQIHSK